MTDEQQIADVLHKHENEFLKAELLKCRAEVSDLHLKLADAQESIIRAGWKLAEQQDISGRLERELIEIRAHLRLQHDRTTEDI